MCNSPRWRMDGPPIAASVTCFVYSHTSLRLESPSSQWSIVTAKLKNHSLMQIPFPKNSLAITLLAGILPFRHVIFSEDKPLPVVLDSERQYRFRVVEIPGGVAVG